MALPWENITQRYIDQSLHRILIEVFRQNERVVLPVRV